MVEPRTLLLLRHGRTAWNLERRIQGQQDTVLDDVGHAQAREVAAELAPLEPALLWTSDLARARATADHLGAACGLEPVPDERLREYAFGPRETLTHEEWERAHPEEFAAFRRGEVDAVRSGERTADVAARMTATLTELLGATPPGRLSVAVSHGAAIRVGTAAMLGWPAEMGLTLGVLGNCCWVLLGESAVTGRLRLVAYNRHAAGARHAPSGPDFAASPAAR